jgi:hypothetical protein
MAARRNRLTPDWMGLNETGTLPCAHLWSQLKPEK